MCLLSVPSQCLLARTLGKKQMLMSVTTKVALQLNCKLGGELWAVEIPVCWGVGDGQHSAYSTDQCALRFTLAYSIDRLH